MKEDQREGERSAGYVSFSSEDGWKFDFLNVSEDALLLPVGNCTVRH